MVNSLEIEPYVEPELDCLQNLYASLLQAHGLEVRYLGAIWPWEFRYIGDHKKYQIENTRCVTQKRLKTLYGVDLLRYKPETTEMMWEEIQQLLKQGIAVVAEIDQYYVPYHYPYIYQKKHGVHFVLLLGYNSKTDVLDCIDTIPKYKGTLRREEFLDGIKSNGRLWYSVIQFPQENRQIGEKVVWQNFHVSIMGLNRKYNTQMEIQKVYTSFFISRLKYVLEDRESQTLLQELVYMCNGTWGWEVDRKGNWLIEYIRITGKKKNTCFNELAELIRRNNQNWTLVFRLLFRESKRKPREEMVLEAIRLLYVILELEGRIAQTIGVEGI